MNYVNITDANPTININLNYDFNELEGRNGDDIDFYLYKDGSSVNIATILQGEALEWSGNVADFKYYQTTSISVDLIPFLKDETNYSLIAIGDSDKIIYRGKVRTTKQPLEDYSVNNSRYNQKTTTNNYTILD